MMEIERPKIETASLSPDGRYGKFVAEPEGGGGYCHRENRVWRFHRCFCGKRKSVRLSVPPGKKVRRLG